jgi:YD repeat-containing protein
VAFAFQNIFRCRNRAIALTIPVDEETIHSTIPQPTALQPLASSENDNGLRILHCRRKQMLKKTVIRDGQNRVVGSTTSGYAAGTSIVRDAEGRLLGKTSETFHNTRDAQGKLVSTNTPDAGLLFGNDDE